ncbi:unnamed protein product [Schistosoma curassoni]|uniref:Ig-like domain-containing protein n=1 Tax=Schistosoma curassoni TaxID=6186 RepID=A0A183JH05_9TREM|nr:unnamed protein product [Schistosoma curassoni]
MFLHNEAVTPPSIRFSSQEGEHNIALGSNLALFCVATGHPLPKITWTKDGKSINDRKFTISEDNVHLRLINVEENDNGRYACHVISEYGQVSKTFDVKITCKYYCIFIHQKGFCREYSHFNS